MEFGGAPPIQLKASVTNNLAIYLAETPLSANQKIQSKGNQYIVTAEVNDSWQLRWWILSQGSAITVLSPTHIRQGISETLRTAAGNYF